MKTLVVYSSKYGATEKCAQRIKEKLGPECDAINLLENSKPSLSTYDTIMLGSSVYAGKMRPDILKLISNEEALLREKKIGIFLCCKDEGAEALKYIDENLPEWANEQAFLKIALGHEINLEKMNFVERSILKMIFKVKESYSRIDEGNIDKAVKAINDLQNL